ncbi:hypothetical protein IWQ62_001953 [Dispira parvispora]|uniref:Uncharacterized protein n=1 Tax=Dispira parvispora TaxID=1520584 RepID=A0A9W8AXU7_9FUNG|nr:hypothetical protein IWQ62_001953 [Dispira parvispora]
MGIFDRVLSKNTVMEGLGPAIKPTLVYNGIFMFAVLFDVVAWWDALMHQNVFQAGVLILFNMMCIAYSVIQAYGNGSLRSRSPFGSIKYEEAAEALIDEFELIRTPGFKELAEISKMTVKNNIGYLELTMITVTSAVTLFLMVVAYPLYRQTAWQFYERLGADKQLRRMNFEYLTLNSLLKLDTFFFLSYTVQMISLVLRDSNAGTTVRAMLCIPISVIIISLGFVGARWENRKVMLVFIGGLVLGMGYMLFELIHMSLYQGKSVNPYEFSSDFLYFFSAATMVLVLLSLYYAFRCYRNFGKGLHLARAYSSSNTNAMTEDQNNHDNWLAMEDNHAPSKPVVNGQ